MKKFYISRIILAFSFLLFFTIYSQAQTQQFLHFDHDDDIIEIPAASQYIAGSNEISMTGWFYCDALGYGQGYLSFRNGGTGDGQMYLIQLNNGKMECRLIINGTTYEVATADFVAVPEVWQHVAWVYDGSKVELFMDGISIGSTPASGTIASTDTPLSIGKHISPWGLATWDGGIDEVTLWSKALTQAEIQEMMVNELNGNEPGLELYYKFNQGVPGGDNSSITTLISEVEPGVRDGDLVNFDMTGEISNFVGTVDNSVQVITFPVIPDKLVTDVPFDLTATASSGLTVNYEVVSGPASVSGNTVTLDGVIGVVEVKATQPGDGTFSPAPEIILSFQVLNPDTFVPSTEVRSPLSGDVMVPSLGPIQLAAISNIDFPDLFNVANVTFQIDGETIVAKDWGNGHYTGWWTPPFYGDFTMNVFSENNYGAVGVESITFTIVDQASNMTVNAGTDVWVYVNNTEEIVEVELPSYAGAFDQIVGNFDIGCPTGGCDPWDRVSGIDVKGHNGEWYEIIRYITPYGIACNSAIDLTDFMSTLQGKVAFRFRLGTPGNGFLYTLNLDYQAGTPTHAYSSITKLWYETYDFGNMDNLQPTAEINAQYPANVLAAKLKLVSTGHGWGDNNTANAAEFHEDTHHIWVDGSQTFEQHNWSDCDPNPDGCNNQNGTWFYDRAGWCPGSIAPWFDYDMGAYINQNDVTLKYVFDEDYTDFCNASNPDCVSGVTCDNCNDGFNPHLIVSSYLITLGDAPLDEVITANENLEPALVFHIFPNPSKGNFNIELAEQVEELKIRVFNNLGQEVFSIERENPNLLTSFELQDAASGIYIIEMHTDKGIGMGKVIVE